MIAVAGATIKSAHVRINSSCNGFMVTRTEFMGVCPPRQFMAQHLGHRVRHFWEERKKLSLSLIIYESWEERKHFEEKTFTWTPGSPLLAWGGNINITFTFIIHLWKLSRSLNIYYESFTFIKTREPSLWGLLALDTMFGTTGRILNSKEKLSRSMNGKRLLPVGVSLEMVKIVNGKFVLSLLLNRRTWSESVW